MWNHANSTIDIEARFKQKHSVVGSMFQGLVLLAFNSISRVAGDAEDVVGKVKDKTKAAGKEETAGGVVAADVQRSGGHLTFRQLCEVTGMADTDVKRALLCLTLGKFKLLAKEPAGKSFDDGDKVSVNEGFTSK
jgi:hypothetical protein